ncbi:transcriptional coactivator p15/PC4 family protein [Reyranella sp.]|uniref:transcriptional coactivator p15/PC4 family protein n=1 Tax=Reyranella sp. TaxID=1929291 RepID=UPI003D0AA032
MEGIDRWICDIQKNSREVYRFQLTEYRGHHLGNVRVFYRVDGGDELRPGKSGISIRVEKLVEFQTALAKLVDAARGEGPVE